MSISGTTTLRAASSPPVRNGNVRSVLPQSSSIGHSADASAISVASPTMTYDAARHRRERCSPVGKTITARPAAAITSGIGQIDSQASHSDAGSDGECRPYWRPKYMTAAATPSPTNR